MTLLVAVSSGKEYAVTTTDRALLEAQGVTEFTGVSIIDGIPYRKVRRLTDWCLLGMAGCVAIGRDFAEIMGEKVGPDDDVSACQDADRETVEELLEFDRPGEAYVEAGVTGRRLSIVQEYGFGYSLNGFVRDGGTAIGSGRGVEVDDLVSDGGVQLGWSVPFGIEDDELEPLSRYTLDDIKVECQLENGFRRAFNFHRVLGRAHADKISRETDVMVLTRPDRSRPPVLAADFTIDREDRDAFTKASKFLRQVRRERRSPIATAGSRS